MQSMIQEYKKSRQQLSERIHELNAQLKGQKSIGHMQAEKLEARRDLLTRECIELLHAIREMEAHSDEREYHS